MTPLPGVVKPRQITYDDNLLDNCFWCALVLIWALRCPPFPPLSESFNAIESGEKQGLISVFSEYLNRFRYILQALTARQRYGGVTSRGKLPRFGPVTHPTGIFAKHCK